jgi:DNA primase
VRAWADWCVLGIVSGSWTDELAQRVPAGTRVLIRTDADAAGDKYARRIAETLRHCREVDRWIP